MYFCSSGVTSIHHHMRNLRLEMMLMRSSPPSSLFPQACSGPARLLQFMPRPATRLYSRTSAMRYHLHTNKQFFRARPIHKLPTYPQQVLQSCSEQQLLWKRERERDVEKIWNVQYLRICKDQELLWLLITPDFSISGSNYTWSLALNLDQISKRIRLM